MSNVSTPKTRGRKPVITSDVKFNVIGAIMAGEPTPISRFLMKQLVKDGFIGTEKIQLETKRRGRQPSKWIATGKAKSWYALIERNKAKAAAKAALETPAVEVAETAAEPAAIETPQVETVAVESQELAAA